MNLRLIVVEQTPLPPELGAVLCEMTTPAGLVLERISWVPDLRLDTAARAVAALLPVVGRERAAAEGLIDWLAAQQIGCPTMAIAAAETSTDVLSRLCAAVDAFLLWPAPAAELRPRLTRLVGDPSTRDIAQLARQLQLANLVGTSPPFLRVLEQLPTLARSDYPV